MLRKSEYTLCILCIKKPVLHYSFKGQKNVNQHALTPDQTQAKNDDFDTFAVVNFIVNVNFL